MVAPLGVEPDTPAEPAAEQQETPVAPRMVDNLPLAAGRPPVEPALAGTEAAGHTKEAAAPQETVVAVAVVVAVDTTAVRGPCISSVSVRPVLGVVPASFQSVAPPPRERGLPHQRTGRLLSVGGRSVRP